MEFYSVYQLGEAGGRFGCAYFMSFDKAKTFYDSWVEQEPYCTVLLDYECTED